MSVTIRDPSFRPKPSIARATVCQANVLSEMAHRQENLYAIERGYDLIRSFRDLEASAEGFIP